MKRRAPARTAAWVELNSEQVCPAFIPSPPGESVRSDHENQVIGLDGGQLVPKFQNLEVG